MCTRSSDHDVASLITAGRGPWEAQQQRYTTQNYDQHAHREIRVACANMTERYRAAAGANNNNKLGFSSRRMKTRRPVHALARKDGRHMYLDRPRLYATSVRTRTHMAPCCRIVHHTRQQRKSMSVSHTYGPAP
jgi:hypothetical protein